MDSSRKTSSTYTATDAVFNGVQLMDYGGIQMIRRDVTVDTIDTVELQEPETEVAKVSDGKGKINLISRKKVFDIAKS